MNCRAIWQIALYVSLEHHDSHVVGLIGLTAKGVNGGQRMLDQVAGRAVSILLQKRHESFKTKQLP